MKLYGTYPSHFTRKVRIGLHELGVPFTFETLTGINETGAQHFADNPLHRFPVLVEGSQRLWESDLICSYLSENYSSSKTRFDTLHLPIDELQLLAVMNGAMACGVQLIRIRRSEIPIPQNFMKFRQDQQALVESLEWLDRWMVTGGVNLGSASQSTIVEVTLMCLLEWAVFREMIPSLASYPHLDKFVLERKDHSCFQLTHPSRTES